MLKRLLRITSHAGKYRYLAEVGHEIVGWVPRQADIPSPFASGPTHGVYLDPQRGPVIIVETAHRRFDVFSTGDLTVSKEDQ